MDDVISREVNRAARRDRQQRHGRVFGRIKRRMVRARRQRQPEPREYAQLVLRNGAAFGRGPADMVIKRFALRGPFTGALAEL